MQKTTPERAKNSSAPSPALLAAGVGVWQLASPAHSAEEDFCCSLHHHTGKTEERQHGKCPQNHQKQLWCHKHPFCRAFSQGELLSAPCFWCGGHRRAPRGRSASDPGSRCTGAITCPRLRATLLANWSGRRISIKKNQVREGLSVVSLKYKAGDLYPAENTVFAQHPWEPRAAWWKLKVILFYWFFFFFYIGAAEI